MVFRRFARVARVIHLMNQPNGTTIRELMQELEVTERSVYRVLDGLDLLSVPFFTEQVPGERTLRYKLAPDFAAKLPTFSIPNFGLNLLELVALCIACADPGPMRGTGLEQALTSSKNKLAASLPNGLSEKMSRLLEAFVSMPQREKILDGKEEFVENLVQAILSRHCCRMKYHSFSSGKVKSYCLEPLHFFEYQGGLYLYANVPAYNDIRIFAVQRIQHVEILDEQFIYPEHFDVESKLREPFGVIINDPLTVTVQMNAHERDYAIEQRFFANQDLIQHPDGSVTATFTTSGRRDVISWVLGSLGNIEVMEPKDLRDEIFRLSKEIASLHSAQSSPIKQK